MNPQCPLLGQLWKETPFVFTAAGENGVNPTLLMPQVRKGWEAGVEGEPVCCRLYQPGPCWSPWNGYVTVCSSATPSQGWLQFCLQQLDWLVCHVCVPLDQLWNGPKPGESLSHKDYPFSSAPGLRVWWVNFLFISLHFVVLLFCFLSLCIAASGLHEGCWVCMHFNKQSIKMLLIQWFRGFFAETPTAKEFPGLKEVYSLSSSSWLA